MQSNNSKNKLLINADLHCHTIKSFDAFTSPKELLKACIIKKINLIAITEHDLINKVNKKLFLEKGINIIDGCEYTTDKGAHIIGLFVKNNLIGGNYREVISHIKNQSGLVLIPHPFKKKSGIFRVYENYNYILDNADFIELYNGGYHNTEKEKLEIINLSKRFNIRMLANSDSHKVQQVGYYINQFNVKKDLGLRDLLTISKPNLLADENFRNSPRNLSKIQNIQKYQDLISNLPFKLKRYIKILLYILSIKKIHKPSYIKLK